MQTHLAIFFADCGDAGSFEKIKSPNPMGWLYWRFAAMTVENHGNGHTWRMPANLIANMDMPDISDFMRRSRLSVKIARRPGAAIAIFAGRRHRRIKSPISDMSIPAIKFVDIRQVCPFPRFSTIIAANRQKVNLSG